METAVSPIPSEMKATEVEQVESVLYLRFDLSPHSRRRLAVGLLYKMEVTAACAFARIKDLDIISQFLWED